MQLVLKINTPKSTPRDEDLIRQFLFKAMREPSICLSLQGLPQLVSDPTLFCGHEEGATALAHSTAENMSKSAGASSSSMTAEKPSIASEAHTYCGNEDVPFYSLTSRQANRYKPYGNEASSLLFARTNAERIYSVKVVITGSYSSNAEQLTAELMMLSQHHAVGSITALTVKMENNDLAQVNFGNAEAKKESACARR